MPVGYQYDFGDDLLPPFERDNSEWTPKNGWDYEKNLCYKYDESPIKLSKKTGVLPNTVS